MKTITSTEIQRKKKLENSTSNHWETKLLDIILTRWHLIYRTYCEKSTVYCFRKQYLSDAKCSLVIETIAKAAACEGVSAAKMSRSIKNAVKFGDYYYCVSV